MVDHRWSRHLGCGREGYVWGVATDPLSPIIYVFNWNSPVGLAQGYCGQFDSLEGPPLPASTSQKAQRWEIKIGRRWWSAANGRPQSYWPCPPSMTTCWTLYLAFKLQSVAAWRSNWTIRWVLIFSAFVVLVVRNQSLSYMSIFSTLWGFST